MIALLVAAGAAVGAPARYLTDRALARRLPGAFPWGTFAVNVVASFVLGVVVGLSGHVSDEAQSLVATGFCGALSTFSTFAYETLALAHDGRRGLSVLYAAASVVAAVTAGALGWALGAH